MTCIWCDKPLGRQRGGVYLKRFCGSACRTAMHTAARQWALAAIDANLITVATLRDTAQCLKTSKTSPARRKPKTSAANGATGPAPSAPSGGPAPSS